MVAALKSRYGMTAREARAKLACLRRDPKMSLQEYGSQVERLVAIAPVELPEQYRQEMIIENFCTSIGNGNLQRHLSAMPTPTLEDAIRAGNEDLQLTVVNSLNCPSNSHERRCSTSRFKSQRSIRFCITRDDERNTKFKFEIGSIRRTQ